MCLAVPAQIIKLQDMLATIEINGVTRQASIMLVPEAKVGDYVLVHAGFAIQLVDQEEAERTMELLKELAQYEDQ
ncbi:MAG: hybG [Firmicutes bacterium]|nr:hybG [Bacillota bacterium]